jgi:hypothetical protein
MKRSAKTPSKQTPSERFPLFCDYHCEHAEFTQPDAVGACRRDLAVYCSFFDKYNNKNSSCLGRKK